MKRILYFVLAAAVLAMFGCTGDTNTDAVTNPNAKVLTPTGTIQGKLVDTCTQQPIAGAVIDAGVAKATTSETGQYTLKNVPATTSANDGRVRGYISVTIDLRNAIDPATGKKVVAGVYPAFAFSSAKVVFSNLDDANAGKDSTNSTNHDTAITGILTGAQDFYAGKLDANIKGSVVMKPKAAGNPAVGYFVKLVACDCSCGYGDCAAEAGDSNSTTGFSGNVVKTTVTDASGNYTFTGVEAGRKFKVVVTDTDTTKTASAAPSFEGYVDACAGCDNTVVYPDAIEACPTAALDPCLIGVDPVKYANVKPDADGNVVVKFTFNKAITGNSNNGLSGDAAVDALSLSSAGNPNSLYANVDVEFLGYKDSNVAFKLSWNSPTNTVLTVTIPNAQAAAVYAVDISRALNHTKHSDLLGADASLADAESWNNWKNPPIAANDDCDVSPKVLFYTFGASDAAAPTSLQAINGPYDYNSPFTLSWVQASQAKAYNVYCQPVQNYIDGTTEAGGYVIVDPLVTATADTFSFSEYALSSGWMKSLGIQNLTGTFVENNNIKITYNCYVAGVNADGTEGAASNIIGPIQDTVAPIITSSSLLSRLESGAPFTTFTITFDEPMNKATVQNAANYTLNAAAFFAGVTPPTVSSAVYDESTRVVTVTLSAALNPADVVPDEINTGANGINNTALLFGYANSHLLSDGTTVINGIPVNQGAPNSACVSESGTAGTAQTTKAGDDVQVIAVAAATTPGAVIVDSGANGVCNTTAVADDVQSLPVGQGLPNQLAIFVAFGNTAVASPDDVVVHTNFITLGAALTDVAGNAIDTTADQINTNGAIH